MLRPLALLLVFAACGAPRPTYVEPPAKVDLVVEPGRATVTWEMGLNARSVVLSRTTGQDEVIAPDGGVRLGDELGRGVVRYLGDDTRFADTNLPDDCGPFSWHVWSVAADGTFASAPATVRSLKGAHTIAPTAEVTALVSAVEGSTVRLQWTPPEANTGFFGVTVVKRAGAPATSLDDGVTVYRGPSATWSEPLSGLSSSQPTYFSVFNCNDCGKCGATAPSVAVSPPQDGGADLVISGLTAQVVADGGVIELSWTSTAPTVKVLRKLSTPPTSLQDPSAVVVYEGPGTRAMEATSALLPDLPLRPSPYVYAAWACVGALCSTTPATRPFSLTLRQALRGGGYTVMLGHATAGQCVDQTSLGTASNTTSPNWWKSCEASCATATAEQLDPTASAAELTSLRTFFQANGVQFGRVLSSEFCRAVRTAEGLQAGPVVEQLPQLTYFVYEEANRCRDTTSLLNARPSAGTNTVLVGHGLYSASCPVLGSIGPAEALVYKPQLGAPPLFLVRLTASQWAGLP